MKRLYLQGAPASIKPSLRSGEAWKCLESFKRDEAGADGELDQLCARMHI